MTFCWLFIFPVYFVYPNWWGEFWETIPCSVELITRGEDDHTLYICGQRFKVRCMNFYQQNKNSQSNFGYWLFLLFTYRQRFYLFELLFYLLCFTNAVHPIKEFRQVVVTGMAAIPGGIEIYIYAAVLQFQCQNSRNRQCRVAVNSSMANAEVLYAMSVSLLSCFQKWIKFWAMRESA